MKWFGSLTIILLVSAGATSCKTPGPRQEIGVHSESAWDLYGHDLGNQRFSTLASINATNVSSLELAYVVHTGVIGPFETSPIMVGGRLYITTPYDGVLALDASSGKRVWYRAAARGSFVQCCGPVNRGVAVDEKRVFVGFLGGRLVALDRNTGLSKWSTVVARNSDGYAITMAPAVYKDTIYVGVAGGQFGVRAFMSAYSARNGNLRWRWYSTDPVLWSRPIGESTPNHGKVLNDGWKRGGGAIWTTPAIDSERNTLIFGTGNPWPTFDGRTRPGRNLFTDCIIALDASTGKLRWFFQETPHDVEDLDVASPPILFDTLDSQGERVKAVGQAGKTGMFYILDRDTGRLIRKTSLVVKTQSDRGDARLWDSGTTWSPTSYDPRRHLVIVSATQRLRPKLGASATNGGVLDPRNWEAGFGTVSAIDVQTGKLAWQDRFDLGIVGGSASTAGGLTFVGEGSGRFDALETVTGRLLWNFQTTAGVNAPPIVFGENGKEFVAVAAGGNQQLGTPYGDTVLVFQLRSS